MTMMDGGVLHFSSGAEAPPSVSIVTIRVHTRHSVRIRWDLNAELALGGDKVSSHD